VFNIRLPEYHIGEVYPDRFEALAEHLSNWALRSFEIKKLHQYTKGKGVKVLVCDTGCSHRDIHPVKVKDFTGKNNPKDSNGHGTWVAGVIGANGKFLGIAPECELYVAKVLGDDGVGSYKWLCDALVWGLEEDVDIVNLSLGGDYESTLIKTICDEYDRKGKIIFCAAGNENDRLDFPAKLESTIAVGAVNKMWQRAYFSDYGPRLIVMAPGVELLGPYLNDGYCQLSGTSMATPIVAGITVLKKSLEPDLNKEKCIKYFKKTCKDIAKPGWDEKTGYGIIQPDKFLNIKASKEKEHAWWILAILAYLLFRNKK